LNDIFITNIHVKQSRNISNFDIPLSQEKRSHLILTGKNGSGKTSLLMDLHDLLSDAMQEGRIRTFNYSVPFSSDKLSIALFNQKGQHEVIKTMIRNGTCIVACFDAKRLSNMVIPTGVKKIGLKGKYSPAETAYKDFIQYIVNLKAERSFARDDNDIASSQKIDEWFDRFLQRLRKLFQSPKLELEFDRKSYDFLLKEQGKLPYTFNTLSDGFSALFMIVSEIIMRMEGQNATGYDRQGIVLIDEIETHLHVSLQKEIMPLLTDFFPNIQFIVTTHSPFVISSIENSVICDLEQKTVANDLSAYSYSILAVIAMA
jgi:predicted ATP-binding protein involved in virulence